MQDQYEGKQSVITGRVWKKLGAGGGKCILGGQASRKQISPASGKNEGVVARGGAQTEKGLKPKYLGGGGKGERTPKLY